MVVDGEQVVAWGWDGMFVGCEDDGENDVMCRDVGIGWTAAVSIDQDLRMTLCVGGIVCVN